MQKTKAIILATEGITTNLLYHTLSNHFDTVEVMLESKVSKWTFIKTRLKKLGIIEVLGQVLFMRLIQPKLIKASQQRQEKIIQSHGRNGTEIPKEDLTFIQSVNDHITLELIKQANAGYIFVNGTRIISKRAIESIGLPLINIHTGITPAYRGVHGGYWALFNKEPHLFGTTLHLIDQGIDSGQIISQKVGSITTEDSFATYPIIQYCIGLDLIDTHIQAIKSNQFEAFEPLSHSSKLWYHPTIWAYLKQKKNGVR